MFDFLKPKTVDAISQNLTARDESPGSAEVFSLERLQARAAELAITHRVARRKKSGFDLLARLEDNKKFLFDAFQSLTGAADSRAKILGIAAKYQETQIFERAEKLAWTRSQVELRYLGISTNEANIFQRLAGHLIYANETLRPRPHILKLNRGMQKDLWKYGIGGDLPLMIVRVSEGKDARSGIRQMLREHAFLHGKKLLFDLLILNDQPPSYEQSFNEDLQSMIRSGRNADADG